MKTLYIAAIGGVGFPVLNWIEAAAAEWFAFPIRRLSPLLVPEDA